MKRAAVKIVPKLLNFVQKQHRMDIAQEMLTTFNNNSDLLKKVITGRPKDVNDDARPGRLSTSTTDENIEAEKTKILDNRRITIRELTDDVGILFGSCQTIFIDDLGMKRAAVRIVPKLQHFEQKLDIAQEIWRSTTIWIYSTRS